MRLAAVSKPSSAAPLPDPLPVVRQSVRALLLASPAYRELPADRQRALARSMVQVCHAAAALLREEVESDRAAQVTPQRPRQIATAQSAGDSFSGVSASRVAGTTREILNAVSFPRFVTDLINGVFQAMLSSSMQQMNAFVELLNNVAASTEGFGDANMGADRARAWLVEHFPDAFELTPADDSSDDGSRTAIQVRDGARMPTAEALRTTLGIGPDETAPPGGDPEALLPLARRQIAKTRQSMLATMVMLGMQRIVVESGKINAAMRFHIDTRSAAQDDRGSTFNLLNQINASGSYGVGLWSASASISNTIGYVSTQRTQTTEEMNTDLDLNSSVEINFKSDYLPLNRMASSEQVSRIRANTLNPDAEEAVAAEQARTARAASAAQSDRDRRASLDRALTPQAPAALPAPAAPRPTTPPAQHPPSGTPPATQHPAPTPAAQHPPSASASAPAAQQPPAAA